MATVEVIEPRKKVKVGPDKPSAGDVLEYAALAIERYGWRKGPTMDEPSSGTMQDLADSGVGLSLHDALGYAQASLSESTGARSGGKDAPVGEVRRDATMRAVTAEIERRYPGKRFDDKTFNDQTTEQEVLEILRATAREAAVA